MRSNDSHTYTDWGVTDDLIYTLCNLDIVSEEFYRDF